MKHKFYLKKKGRYKQPDGRMRYVVSEIENGIVLKEIAVPKPEKLFKILSEQKQDRMVQKESTI